MRHCEYDAALLEWAAVLGPENVVTEPASLRAAETGTFATGYTIPAIIRPGSRRQVQECLRIANRCGTPVYPISSGRNWGYGSRVPATGLAPMSRRARFATRTDRGCQSQH